MQRHSFSASNVSNYGARHDANSKMLGAAINVRKNERKDKNMATKKKATKKKVTKKKAVKKKAAKKTATKKRK